MFDKKKKFIYDFNINQLKKLGPYFTIEKLGEVDIHPAIETFVNAAIDDLIFQDRQQLTGNSIFDYSGDEIGGYLASVDDILKKRKKFSLKFFAGLIEEAIDFNINFIQTPKPELLTLVFQDKQHMPVQDIIQRLKHLYYYEYFNKVIISFVSRKNIIALNKDEFNELLTRVDKLSTESNQKEILENFVTAASSFFNIGNAGKNDIPLEAFTLFIDGKGLHTYNEALKNSIGDTPQSEYDPTYFIKILNSVVEEKVEYVAEEPGVNDMDTGLDDFEGGEVSEEKPEELTSSVEEINEELDEIPEQGIEDKSAAEEIKDIAPFEEGTDEKAEEEDHSVTSFFGAMPDEDETNETEEEDNEEFIVADGINLDDFTEVDENEETDDSPLEEEEENAGNDDPSFEEGEPEAEDFADIFAGISEETEEPVDEEESATEEAGIPVEAEEKTETFPDFNFENEDSVEENTETDESGTDNLYEEVKDETNTQDEPENVLDDSNGTSFNASMGIGFNDEEEQAPLPLNSQEVIDPAEILDHPNMSKIIIEVFDYDMEEFADTMELIAHSGSKEKALDILDTLFERNGVEKSSKEAQNFIDIILEYFD
ncbi:MAG: hypothetical protein SCALA702_21230 [Melioribacteraceae bacterium]|nr:MAG: hypothetical protein SCALA702_21230 [Melioribacteraceae bacterium]